MMMVPVVYENGVVAVGGETVAEVEGVKVTETAVAVAEKKYWKVGDSWLRAEEPSFD